MSRSVILQAAMVAAFVALAAEGALGEAPRAKTQDLARARQQLYGRAESAKGTNRILLMQEKRKVESLIDDLEAGRPVDPAEVERALNRAQRPIW